MNIVYATDEYFAPVTAVSLLSLLEHHRDVPGLIIYLLDDGLSDQSRERLSGLAARESADLRFVPVLDIEKNLSVRVIMDRGTRLTTFARLFLPSLLPDADRVLYLDADTLVTDSLLPFWGVSLSKSEVIAGVADCIGKKHKENIGLAAKDPYLNAGVVLFDLEKMRREGTERAFGAYLRERGGQKIPFTDQGVLNAVLKGKIRIMPPRYNVVSLMYAASYEDMVTMKRAEAYFPKAEWEKAKAAPALVHFTTCFLLRRPWEEGSTHPLAALWRETCRRTPWETFSHPARESGPMRAYAALCRALPHRLAAELTGFVHGTLKAAADRAAGGGAGKTGKRWKIV